MATSFLEVKNNAISTLASGITDVATSLTVASGEGALFPSSFPFHITIENEILSCTNRSTDVLTVVREQQGTSGVAHSVNVAVGLNVTAKSVTDLNTAVNAAENKIGTGASTPTANKVLRGTGTGTSAWAQVNLSTDVTGSLPDGSVANDLTISGGTVDGSVVGGSSAAAITGTAVTGTSIVGGTVAGTTGTFSGVVDVTDTTDASDATGDTGALRTEGGASIAKKLYVGTDLDVDGTAELDNITIAGAQGSDGQVLTSTGSGVGWEDAGGGGGIENADHWRLTGGFNGSENPITSNWVRASDDEADYGELGTQVYKHDGSTTYDGEIRPSGTFAFPSTGIWLVTAFLNCVTASSTADNQARVVINIALNADDGTNGDGGTYNERAAGLYGLYSTTGYGSASCQAIVDVTNKTNVAVTMGCKDQAAGTYSNGSTSSNETGIVFLRIGDT